jgi:hypothetical protein
MFKIYKYASLDLFYLQFILIKAHFTIYFVSFNEIVLLFML